MDIPATDLMMRAEILSFLVHISQPGKPSCSQGPGAASLATHLNSTGWMRNRNQAGLGPSNRSHAEASGKPGRPLAWKLPRSQGIRTWSVINNFNQNEAALCVSYSCGVSLVKVNWLCTLFACLKHVFSHRTQASESGADVAVMVPPLSRSQSLPEIALLLAPGSSPVTKSPAFIFEGEGLTRHLETSKVFPSSLVPFHGATCPVLLGFSSPQRSARCLGGSGGRVPLNGSGCEWPAHPRENLGCILP